MQSDEYKEGKTIFFLLAEESLRYGKYYLLESDSEIWNLTLECAAARAGTEAHMYHFHIPHSIS